MSVLEAIFLGFVQGVTSFLPVSSSGHVVIMEQIFHIKCSEEFAHTIFLNLGTLIAMLIAFRSDLVSMFHGTVEIILALWDNMKMFWLNTIHGRNDAYIKVLNNNKRKFAFLVYVSILPTLFFGSIIRNMMTDSFALMSIGLNLLITGILLLVVDYVNVGNRQPKEATLIHGLLCGFCQSLAVFPGISRYGITLSSGILCGFNKKFAMKYSFMISIPAIIGVIVYDLRVAISSAIIDIPYVLCGLVGTATACIVGFFSIRIMINFVQNKKLRYFSIYCFIIGMIAIIGNFQL